MQHSHSHSFILNYLIFYPNILSQYVINIFIQYLNIIFNILTTNNTNTSTTNNYNNHPNKDQLEHPYKDKLDNNNSFITQSIIMDNSTNDNNNNPVSTTKTIESLTLSGAKIIASGCSLKANELGIDFNIAIVDQSTHLLYFERMNNAKYTSISIAIDKAFTAAGHRNPTSFYKDRIIPGSPMYGINFTNNCRFNTIAGGIPIFSNNNNNIVIGGIGVSTGTPDQDNQVAEAGIAALKQYWNKQKDNVQSKL